MPDEDERRLVSRDEEGDEDGTGSAPSRLLSLCDGVFAIALTLLVLDLALPDGLQTADDVNAELVKLLPNVLAFLISFAVLGRYWLAHRAICADLRKTDTRFLWMNLFFLLPIAVMPFTTKMLAEYGEFAVPVVIYAADIALCGVTAVVLGEYSIRRLDRPRSTRSPLNGLAVVAVFVVSIPIAFASPTIAKCVWILIPLVGYLVGVYEGHRRPARAVR